MKGRKTWERGYAAGLIDGEGCISIKKVSNFNTKRNVEYSLQININMTDIESLDFMFGGFGGRLYKNLQSIENRLPVNRWEITREPAKKFLKQILPFLKVKKSQAELAIRFQELRKKEERENGRYRPIPQFKLDKYEQFYQAMRNMKISNAGVTTKRVEPTIISQVPLLVSDSLVLQEV